jgi:hypothetical protein
MATEFKVSLANKPGTLARLGTVLGDANVNISAMQGFSHGEDSIVQFVPDNLDQTTAALKASGITYIKREVLIVRVLDEPGALGDVAFVMAKAGINIDSVYVTSDGYVVLGVDDLDGAIQVAGGMAVMMDKHD